MDVEHPEITRTERTGYHDIEYSRWELQQQEEADEEEWPDGLRYAEWQKEKTLCANREPAHPNLAWNE